MKTIDQFLGELEEELQYLNAKDRLEVVKHYRDKINISVDYGNSIQKVLATLPTPQKIAEEVYASKGINFIEKRKKAKRRKQIFLSIINSIIILMLLAGFVTVAFYDIYYVVRLCILIGKSFNFFNFLDTLLLILLNISYIGILLIGLIYIFDLFYIIVMHLLETILDTINKDIKEYPFMDFTLSGIIEKKLKKKKLIFKVLIGCFIAFVFFGVSGYLTKGYIYRSMNNTIETRENVIIDEEINNIYIPLNSSFVKITQDNELEKLTIKYGSEFEDGLNYQIADKKLTINPNKAQKYDILGFLNEPRQVVEIILPKNSLDLSINIEFNDGIFDIVNVTNENLNLTITGNNFISAITKTHIKSFNAAGREMNLALQDNIINNVDIKMNLGTYKSVGDYNNSLKIVNNLGTIILQKTYFNVANIENTSGKAAIDKIDANELVYTAIRSEDYFQDNVYNKVNLSILYNSNVQMDRVVITSEFIVKEDGGYLKIDYLKTPSIYLDAVNGTFNLYHLGENLNINTVDPSNELYEYYNKYNDPKYYKSTTLKATTAQGKISILASNAYSAEFLMNETTLEMGNTNMIYTVIQTNGSKINLTDISGKDINIKTKGGTLVFYNDSESSKNSGIVLEYSGDATLADIDENIKRK